MAAGISSTKRQTTPRGGPFREGFGLIEIEPHSVLTIAPPSFQQRQLAGRVDNPNGTESFQLGDYFTPDTACRAQNQDSRSACALFFN